MRLPARVTIEEVGLRDGLQLIGTVVPVAVKLRLLHALHGAGIRAMEVTSFVSPKAVPQFSDAEAVAHALEFFTCILHVMIQFGTICRATQPGLVVAFRQNGCALVYWDL